MPQSQVPVRSGQPIISKPIADLPQSQGRPYKPIISRPVKSLGEDYQNNPNASAGSNNRAGTAQGATQSAVGGPSPSSTMSAPQTTPAPSTGSVAAPQTILQKPAQPSAQQPAQTMSQQPKQTMAQTTPPANPADVATAKQMAMGMKAQPGFDPNTVEDNVTKQMTSQGKTPQQAQAMAALVKQQMGEGRSRRGKVK